MPNEYGTTVALLAACLLAGGACSDATADAGTPFLSAPPNLLEDFSTYSSTSEMISDPRGIYHLVEDIATNRMVLDQTVGYGSSSKSLRYDWGSGTSTISRMLRVPNAREIWIEWTLRFQVGYSIEWGGGGDAALKFLTVGVVGPAGRFGHGFRFGDDGASNIEAPNDAYTDGFAETNFSLNSVADGQWHTYRYHIKLGNPDLHEFWVDGVSKARKTGFNTSASSIWAVALGRNMNQPATSAESQWWGAVKLWWGSNDPGW